MPRTLLTAEERALRWRGIAALNLAVELAGSLKALAAMIGVHFTTVCCWRTKHLIVPLEHVPFIVAAVDDPRVTPLSLRPDYARGWALLAQQLAHCRIEDEPEPEPEEVA